MKKIIMALACLMTICLMSCSNDDTDNKSVENSLIIGMWQTTYAQGYYQVKKNQPPEYFQATLNETNPIDGLFYRYLFKPNGEVEFYEYNKYFDKWMNESKYKFYYTVTNNTLKIYDDETHICNIFEIGRLNETELGITLRSENSEKAKAMGIQEQYVTLLFKKIY